MSNQPIVYAISDSIGETAEMVSRAAVSQFAGGKIEIIRIPHIATEEKILEIIEQAAEQDRPTVICHTMVSPHLRDALLREAKSRGLLTVDILGPVLLAVQAVSGLEPRLKPGLIHKLDRDYFRRIAAIEFAVKYDDGKDPKGIQSADIVLVGVSRTSKTPLSMYLAHKRLKVANVPLVPEVPPPPELFKVKSKRIIGLIIDPFKLNEIRRERLMVMGLSTEAAYASMERIEEELAYALGVMRKLHCLVLDVSNKAIEETANKILEIAKKNQPESS